MDVKIIGDEIMPALNFTVFIDKIMSGEKTQTIRKERKKPIKIGDTLYLYTGLRTKKARLLKKVRCSKVREIYIDYDTYDIWLDGDEYLNKPTYMPFILADGFAGKNDFFDFFLQKYDYESFFDGVVIYWEDID
jgi:hypothetical protein